MKEIGVFDIIGPVMVGPSSSHTAGALRIASIAHRLAKGKITEVEFELYGSFAVTYKGHGTDRALLGGILGFTARDTRISSAFSHAEEAGLDFIFKPNTSATMPHPNTVDIRLTDETGQKTWVRGVSVGGGAALITSINGIPVEMTGNYNTIIVKQIDSPGMIAHISGAISEHNINIVSMTFYRESKGQTAYAIIETDEEIPKQVLFSIQKLENVISTVVVPGSM